MKCKLLQSYQNKLRHRFMTWKRCLLFLQFNEMNTNNTSMHQKNENRKLIILFKRKKRNWLYLGFKTMKQSYLQYKKHQNILLKTVRRMQSRQLSTSFEQWKYKVANDLRLRRISKRIFLRMRSFKLSNILLVWKYKIEIKIETRLLLSRLYTTFVSRTLRTWLVKWKCKTDYIQHVHEKQLVGFNVMHRLLVKCHYQSIRSCFRMLHKNSSNKIKNEKKLMYILHKMKQKEITKGFNTWYLWYRRQRQHRRLISKSLSRLRRLMVSKCFHQWKDNVNQLLRLKQFIQKMYYGT